MGYFDQFRKDMRSGIDTANQAGESAQQNTIRERQQRREQRKTDREQKRAERKAHREQKRAERKAKRQEIKAQINEKIQGSIDKGIKVADAIAGAKAYTQGVLKSQDARQQMGQALESGLEYAADWAGEKADSAKDWVADEIIVPITEMAHKLEEEVHGLIERGRNQVTQVIAEGQQKLNQTREYINAHILEPGIATAKQVGQAVKTGVETAGLFTIGITVLAVEKGVEVSQAGKEALGEAVEAAKDWTNRFIKSQRQQAEHFSRKVQAQFNEVLAVGQEMAAAPRGLLVRLEAKAVSTLTRHAEQNIRLAEARKQKATDLRTTARTLRTSN